MGEKKAAGKSPVLKMQGFIIEYTYISFKTTFDYLYFSPANAIRSPSIYLFLTSFHSLSAVWSFRLSASTSRRSRPSTESPPLVLPAAAAVSDVTGDLLLEVAESLEPALWWPDEGVFDRGDFSLEGVLDRGDLSRDRGDLSRDLAEGGRGGRPPCCCCGSLGL
jgi:hypothetical protein